MLPEEISNNLCSLNPKENKYSFSALFIFEGSTWPEAFQILGTIPTPKNCYFDINWISSLLTVEFLNI